MQAKHSIRYTPGAFYELKSYEFVQHGVSTLPPVLSEV
jgi:hypothetical protein